MKHGGTVIEFRTPGGLSHMTVSGGPREVEEWLRRLATVAPEAEWRAWQESGYMKDKEERT